MKTLDELMALMPGIEFVGMYSNPHVNSGTPTPVFTSKPRADGKPSINTLEGWNVMAQRINHRSFVQAHGREPKDQDELDLWVKEMCK